jgi:hypothetical protein
LLLLLHWCVACSLTLRHSAGFFLSAFKKEATAFPPKVPQVADVLMSLNVRQDQLCVGKVPYVTLYLYGIVKRKRVIRKRFDVTIGLPGTVLYSMPLASAPYAQATWRARHATVWHSRADGRTACVYSCIAGCTAEVEPIASKVAGNQVGDGSDEQRLPVVELKVWAVTALRVGFPLWRWALLQDRHGPPECLLHREDGCQHLRGLRLHVRLVLDQAWCTLVSRMSRRTPPLDSPCSQQSAAVGRTQCRRRARQSCSGRTGGAASPTTSNASVSAVAHTAAA